MKLIKRLCILAILFFVLATLVFLGLGFVNYKNAITKTSIEEKVAEIQSDKDYVTLDQMNPYLVKATISIEDRRFYDHGGVDYFALARAFVSNVFAKEIVGGGSTITQQLSKNLYFSYKTSYVRKASEIFMAYDIESKLAKDTIIEMYLNVINYGDNYIGIKQASMGYFGKQPMDLTLQEATLLAGIPQSPSNFQLSNHADEARTRQKSVIDAMVRDEHITKTQAEEISSK